MKRANTEYNENKNSKRPPLEHELKKADQDSFMINKEKEDSIRNKIQIVQKGNNRGLATINSSSRDFKQTDLEENIVLQDVDYDDEKQKYHENMDIDTDSEDDDFQIGDENIYIQDNDQQEEGQE